MIPKPRQIARLSGLSCCRPVGDGFEDAALSYCADIDFYLSQWRPVVVRMECSSMMPCRFGFVSPANWGNTIRLSANGSVGRILFDD